jgi:hypothetical protein
MPPKAAEKKTPLEQGFPMIGALRFELGTSSPPEYAHRRGKIGPTWLSWVWGLMDRGSPAPGPLRGKGADFRG